MAAKLYVGNLADKTTAEDLQKIFAVFGTVKWADLATDPGTGRPKGFAFVMMGSDDEARRALAALQGKSHEGKMLKVSQANKKGASHKPKRPAGGPPGRPGGRPRGAPGGSFNRRPPGGRPRDRR